MPAHPIISRPDIPRTVSGILPATAGFTAKAKPPPTTIPIGRARPEGQPPPYPKAKLPDVKAPPPPPCSDAVSAVPRERIHELPHVARDFVGPPRLPPGPIGAASSSSGSQPKAAWKPPPPLPSSMWVHNEARRADLTAIAILLTRLNTKQITLDASSLTREPTMVTPISPIVTMFSLVFPKY